MRARPRVALIGVGRFGRTHLRVLRSLHRRRLIELAGLVGRTPAGVRRLGARLGVRAYRSLDEALSDGLDVADIVTPASVHVRLVERCLRAAHVFVEKPLAPTARACRNLYRQARRQRRLLGVGHIYRFNAAVERVKRLLRGGERPYLVRVEITGRTPAPTDIGAVLTFLHVFDVLDELFDGPPGSIACLGRVIEPGRPFESYAAFALRYPRGLTAIAELGWIGGERRRRLEVAFADLRVQCDLVRQRIELHRSGRGVRVVSLDQREPLRLELTSFLRAVRRGGSLRPTPAQVLRVMRTGDRARQAARTGQPVAWAR
jgi:UDP-N-acetylglucosamine 3-dehydrogenase